MAPPVAAPTAVPQVAPQGTVPVTPVPVQQGGRSCGGTLLIVILTVICTIIVEVVLLVVVGGYLANKFIQNAKKEFSTTIGEKSGDDSSSTGTKSGSGTKATTLTSDQKSLLTSLGIDSKDIPPEAIPKIVCVEEALGADRIKSIVDGKSTPGFADIFKVRGCFAE